jgi:hypothetical protein
VAQIKSCVIAARAASKSKQLWKHRRQRRNNIYR